jgi:hypothetical protein
MTDPVESLVLDMLEWIGPDRRPYVEVLEVWHTSCPRLPVWEEANSGGFINHHQEQGQEMYVSLSAQGKAHLHAKRSQGEAEELL